MRRISTRGRAIIRQQKVLRLKLIPWRVIAELEGVSLRAVLKMARKLT
jgi:hypothetical protein